MKEEQIVGIYNADGGWKGELRYALGLISGGQHCSLCDITHGWNPLGRRDWKRACADAPFKLQLIHRDRASPAQRSAAGALPAVLAGADDVWRVVVDAGELDRWNGDAEALIALIESRI
ncbi:MAG: hypothetical protein OXI56_12310 [bacterium]|nr:hypothetical protein [bacterium]MDE0602569.1 hypothetical protein [bacterium]